MMLRGILCLSLAVVVLSGQPASCLAASDAAHFWLSTAGSGSSGPEAPSLGMALGETTTLYIWGRPIAGKRLQDVSLNLVADATGIDFVDGSFVVNNAITAGVNRFEYHKDSSTLPALVSFLPEVDVAAGGIDDVLEINAFTLSPTSTIRGIGPDCVSGETGCELAGDGEPAWVFGAFDVKAVTAGASVDIFLQVGTVGMRETTVPVADYDHSGVVDEDDFHLWRSSYGSKLYADGTDDGSVDAADYTLWRAGLGDTGVAGATTDTLVRFGVDLLGGDEPTYNAGSDFSTNLLGDDADASITIAGPAAAYQSIDSLSVLPEPVSLVMLAIGMAFQALAARRR